MISIHILELGRVYSILSLWSCYQIYQTPWCKTVAYTDRFNHFTDQLYMLTLMIDHHGILNTKIFLNMLVVLQYYCNGDEYDFFSPPIFLFSFYLYNILNRPPFS